jgi:hypothetical protein
LVALQRCSDWHSCLYGLLVPRSVYVIRQSSIVVYPVAVGQQKCRRSVQNIVGGMASVVHAGGGMPASSGQAAPAAPDAAPAP